jgi:hypothetical protein
MAGGDDATRPRTPSGRVTTFFVKKWTRKIAQNAAQHYFYVTKIGYFLMTKSKIAQISKIRPIWSP